MGWGVTDGPAATRGLVIINIILFFALTAAAARLALTRRFQTYPNIVFTLLLASLATLALPSWFYVVVGFDRARLYTLNDGVVTSTRSCKAQSACAGGRICALRLS